jgi:hypothetical protein
MKNIFIFSFLILTINCFSQDYIDKIVANACDCASKLSDTIDNHLFTMQLGICMIEASRPYEKQIKKDHNINLDALSEEEGVKLGKLVGLKMASLCPKVLMQASKSVNNGKQVSEEFEIKGIVTKVENDCFVVISIKDEFGKISKFYWMTFINSKYNLIDQYDLLTGKTLDIYYKTQEFFDPRIKEYRQFNIMTKMEIL